MDESVCGISLRQASLIADSALREGRGRGLAPLCVAVVDAGGRLVVLKRDDGASYLRTEIAYGKAMGVVGMGMGGRALGQKARDRPTLLSAITMLSGGKLVPGPGGLLVRSRTGSIIGAVGISGDSGDNDEACAFAAISSAGLEADPG